MPVSSAKPRMTRLLCTAILCVATSPGFVEWGARADDACSGILCGLFNGNQRQGGTGGSAVEAGPGTRMLGSILGDAPQTAAPANAGPATAQAPTPPPVASGPQQSGLVGVLNGTPQTTCEGILCGLIEGSLLGSAAAPTAPTVAPSPAEPQEEPRSGKSDPEYIK